ECSHPGSTGEQPLTPRWSGSTGRTPSSLATKSPVYVTSGVVRAAMAVDGRSGASPATSADGEGSTFPGHDACECIDTLCRLRGTAVVDSAGSPWRWLSRWFGSAVNNQS